MLKVCVTSLAVLILLISANVYALSGGGISTNPYLIQSLADFDEFAADENFWNDYVRLECDINLIGRTYTAAVISHGTDFWGGDGIKYIGNFNGNGYVIQNLNINSTGTANGYIGLFGYAYPPGRIYDLGLENCTINADGQYVGSLVGRNQSGTIERCYADCNVINTGSNTGGLVGECWGGTIEDCYTVGYVSGTSAVGGLVGRNGAEVRYSYSIAAVSGSSDVGGLVGEGGWGRVVMGFWDMTATGTTVSYGGFGRSTVQMKTAANYTGWANGTWKIDEAIDYPSLVWENSTGTVINNAITQTYPGTGIESDPFILSSATDLVCLSKRPTDWNDYIELANDINLAGVNDYMPIAYFTGTLNGNGYSIKNLAFDINFTTANMALISYAGYGSTIHDLGIEDANIEGPDMTAGLVGLNSSGTIEHCFTTGRISGIDDVAGLVGKNSNGDVNSCYNLAEVNGNYRVAGIAGTNFGDISNCYNEGDISGAGSTGGLVGQNSDPLINSYSIGQISKVGNYGALVGYNNGQISDSFWDTTVTGIAIGYSAASTGTATNVLGLTTPQMWTDTVYINSGWDFLGESDNGRAELWRLCIQGTDYPALAFEFAKGDFTCPDGVDLSDFAAFGTAWGSQLGDANWNPVCDVANPIDGIIDILDLAVLAGDWLEGI